MAVYVDEIQDYGSRTPPALARRFGTRWSHMTADTREEIHTFARKMGLKRNWFQDHPTLWHYDLTPGQRARAIQLGAQEVVAKEHLRRLFYERRDCRAAKESD